MLSSEQKSSLLYKYYLGMGSTRINREFFEEAFKSSFIVQPADLWTYSDYIPNSTDDTGGADALAQIKALADGEIYTIALSESDDTHPLVKRFIDYKLTKVDDGTDSSFIIADSDGNPIKNIVPFNYYDEVYAYGLKNSAGTKIPFGVGDWVVDIYSGILTFYGDVPTGVDHSNPPLLSFFQYVGGNGFKETTYGYDGAILPIDNIHIASGTAALSKDESTTLYDYIVNKANEIQDDFVSTYGWDGADKNEGIALSFEKVIPLTYTSTQDAVKGYDDSADSEIGTLLSKNASSGTGTYFKVVFASQKCAAGSYTIDIANDIATYTKDGTTVSTINVAGLTGAAYKVFIDTDTFIVIQRIAEGTATESIVATVAAANQVNCLLLYWSVQDAQYVPFTMKEDANFDFGFPVVTVNGTIPPSLQLGTSSLSTFSDTITPDYYGPRTAAIVIANSKGTDIKSADYVVKNSTGYYLNDILDQIKADYTENDEFILHGTIYLRAGTYAFQGDYDFSDWNNISISGEGDATIITSLAAGSITIGHKADTTFALQNIKLIDVASIKATTATARLFLSNIEAPDTDIILTSSTNKTFIHNVNAHNLTADDDNTNVLAAPKTTTYNGTSSDTGSDDDTESTNDPVSLVVIGSYFNQVILNRDNALVSSTFMYKLKVTNEGENFIKGCVIGCLDNKYKDLYITDSTVRDYNTTNIGDKINQTPVGRSDDYTYSNFNKDTLTTSGRFPIFDKSDFRHMKYAEFATPLSYNSTNNLIELLYDSEVFKITDEGKLTTVITSDRIMMPEITFPLNDNSHLPDKTYDNTNSLTDVLHDLWLEKADLDGNGKIPLQEIPDSIAYGGILYVGNWSFEDNSGKYPVFANTSEALSGDEENTTLQKGWFFIVADSTSEETGSEASTDSDSENDDPVAEQVAVDGEKFTAGDWVIYQGTGADDATNASSSWVKINRAYSDPAYSPLPAYAKATGSKNRPWYWKNDRDGGALDLSSNTIVTAFKKVNDQLRKLEPKKPAKCSDVAIDFVEDYDTITYRTIGSNSVVSTDLTTKYDSSKTTEYKFLTHKSDGGRTYKDLIYIGDQATISVYIDSDTPAFTATVKATDTLAVASADNTVSISAPQEPMATADHGEDFWKGVFVTIDNGNLTDGDHYVKIVVSAITIDGDDADQDAAYDSLKLKSYATYKPYIPELALVTDTLLDVGVTRINALKSAEACSGVASISIDSLKNFYDVAFKLANISDGTLNASRIADLKVMYGTEEFCAPINIDSNCSFASTGKGYYNLVVDDVTLPITYSSDTVIPDTASFNFIITFYDLYGEKHDFTVGTYSNLRFDPTLESERCTCGLLANDSDYLTSTGFGDTYPSTSFTESTLVPTQLLKIGEVIDSTVVGTYKWPSGTYYGHDFDTSFVGEAIGEDYYASACFHVATLSYASGFVLDILTKSGADWTQDSLTGATDNIKLQMCLVSNDKKASSWLDCNTPNDGFKTPDESTFNEPVMYAGTSTATTKRITFGKQCLSGELYIRIGIKKDSGLEFTGLQVVEAI